MGSNKVKNIKHVNQLLKPNEVLGPHCLVVQLGGCIVLVWCHVKTKGQGIDGSLPIQSQPLGDLPSIEVLLHTMGWPLQDPDIHSELCLQGRWIDRSLGLLKPCAAAGHSHVAPWLVAQGSSVVARHANLGNWVMELHVLLNLLPGLELGVKALGLGVRPWTWNLQTWNRQTVNREPCCHCRRDARTDQGLLIHFLESEGGANALPRLTRWASHTASCLLHHSWGSNTWDWATQQIATQPQNASNCLLGKGHLLDQITQLFDGPRACANLTRLFWKLRLWGLEQIDLVWAMLKKM